MGVPAEYRDEISRCSDCDHPLEEGPARAPAPDPPRPWGRLAVTLLALAVVLVGKQIVLPGASRTDWLIEWFGGRPGILHLGLGPIVLSFVLVELAALAVPRWRALRGPRPEARRPLTNLAYLLSLPLALLWAGASATLTGGVYASLALAWLVTRYGLGNGFVVVLAADVIPWALQAAGDLWFGWREPAAEPTTATAALLMVALLLAPILLTLYFMRVSAASAGDRATQALRLPVCGIWPLVIPVELWTSMLLGLQLHDVPVTESFPPSETTQSILVLAIVVLLVWPLARLFNAPERVARAIGNGSGGGDGPASVDEVRSPLRRAALWSGIFLALAYAPGLLLYAWIGIGAGVRAFGLVLAAAAGLDLAGEWRYRTGRDEVAIGWSEHRIYAVDTDLATLSEAGIAAYPRAVCFRTLLQFFGPYLPIDLLVPARDAARARALLDG
jgi:preprotein translocase subunit SecY